MWLMEFNFSTENYDRFTCEVHDIKQQRDIKEVMKQKNETLNTMINESVENC